MSSIAFNLLFDENDEGNDSRGDADHVHDVGNHSVRCPAGCIAAANRIHLEVEDDGQGEADQRVRGRTNDGHGVADIRDGYSEDKANRHNDQRHDHVLELVHRLALTEVQFLNSVFAWH